MIQTHYPGKLSDLSASKHIMVQQIDNGHQPNRNLNVKYMNSSRRIMKAVESFEIGIIDEWGFMQRCSHASAHYLDRQMNWTLAVETDERPIHHSLGKDII